MDRRTFLSVAGSGAWLGMSGMTRLTAAGAPADDPLAGLKLAWTAEVRWSTVVDVTRMDGETINRKLSMAQATLAMMGGGVAYFPAGTYKFAETIKLLNGVVLRGADPGPVKSAHNEKYSLPTKFEFPKYVFSPEGDGTPILTAFKGIRLADPAKASNVGVLNIDIDRGHIHFEDDGTEKHEAGSNRFVFGCILRNAAAADPTIPNLKLNQKGWQRFTARHHAAIDVKSGKNLLVANNRLPKSGDGNFAMNGYVLLDAKKKETAIDGVVFDYDNRPGLYVNHYGIGGAGGMGPDGTPESHPHGFRTGIVIRDNYVFNTGRMGIGFCGDGVKCLNNVIRIPDDVWRPTATGTQLTGGASTNDNRAIEMRGWRWTLDGNDYEVHRNWAFDRKYKINDGEGLMHEDHVNSTILDSVLTYNRGNTYLSLYKTAGIDGLLVEGNEIKLGDGRQTIASGAAIFVSADRTKDRFPVKRVSIVKNTVAGGGILLSGDPSEKNVIRGNKALGDAKLPITLRANAEVSDNAGFETKAG
jgi:hypothetical protein